MSNKIYFPAKIDVSTHEIKLIQTTIDELDNYPFHDDRFIQGKKYTLAVDVEKVRKESGTCKISFIFHTAFCGSTFLAKLLGETESYYSIREPSVIMELANLFRVNLTFKDDENLTELWVKNTIEAFIPFTKSKSNLVIKPTNAANNIIPVLLKALPKGKALFLYTDLDGFIISILKKGEYGRTYIRKLYNVLSLDGSPFVLSDFRVANAYTDLQLACLVWCMQISLFKKVSSYENTAFLKASKLFKRPRKSLKIISKYFKQEITLEQMNLLDEKGLLNTHSKFKNKKYNSKIRKKENKRIRKKYKQEIQEVRQWANKNLNFPSLQFLDLF